MSRFGWAFVNDIVTGSGGTPGGSDKQVQFNSGSTFSGSSNLTYDYTTNILSGTTAKFSLVTGSNLVISASVVSASTYLGITAGGATPAGPNTSIQFNSGSSLSGSSNLVFNYTTNTLSGTTAQFTAITGSLFGTSSYATSASYVATASYATTVANGVYTNTNNTFTGVNTFNNQITGTYARFSNDVTIVGTASIGQLNTINQTSLVIGDKYITILSGASDHPSLDGSGILWGSGSIGDPTQDELGANAHVRYDASEDKLRIFPGLYVTGGVGVKILDSLTISGSSTLTTISGTSAQFTNITGSAYIGGSFAGTNGRFTTFRATGATTFDAAMAVSGGISVVNSIVRTMTGSTVMAVMDNFGVISGSGNLLVGGNLTVGGSSTVAHVVSQGSLSAKYQSFTGSFTVPLASWFCGINSSAGAVTASLALANTYFAGQPITFKDIGGFAATAGKGILIQASGSDKIDGASSLVISATSGSVTLVTDGVSNFFITSMV